MKRKLYSSIQAFQSILKTTWSFCWVLIIFTGLAIIGCNNPKTYAKETTDKLEKAKQLESSRDYKSAIKLYSEILATDSTNEEVFKLRAYANTALYDNDTSQKNILKSILKDYDKFISLNPSMNNYHSRALFNHEKIRDNKATLEDLNLALGAKDANKAFILTERGYFHFKYFNDSASAFKDFKTAIDKFPNDSQSYVAYANCLMKSHQWDKAKKILLKWLKVSESENIEIEKKLAICYFKLKDYSQALFLINSTEYRFESVRGRGDYRFYMDSKYKIYSSHNLLFYRGYCKYKLGQMEIGKKEMQEYYEETMGKHIENKKLKEANSNLPPSNVALEIPIELYEIYPNAIKLPEYFWWYDLN